MLWRATPEPVFFAFDEAARFVDGVPVNMSTRLSPSRLLASLEYSPLRQFCRHCTLREARDRDAYFVIGLQGSPNDWLGLSGLPPMSRANGAALRQVLDEHPRLKLLIDYSVEAGLLPDIFEGFYDVCDDLGIDRSRVVYVVSNSGLETVFADWLQSSGRNASDCYSIVGLVAALLWQGVRYSRLLPSSGAGSLATVAAIERLSSTVRSNKCLALPGPMGWPRLMLPLMVHALGLQPHGHAWMPGPGVPGDPGFDGMPRRMAYYGAASFEETFPRTTPYDDHYDIGARLNCLHRELQHLAGMTIDELHDHYYENLGSLIHNRHRLFAMPQLIGETLLTKLRSVLAG